MASEFPSNETKLFRFAIYLFIFRFVLTSIDITVKFQRSNVRFRRKDKNLEFLDHIELVRLKGDSSLSSRCGDH